MSTLERMRREWNRRAKKDANYYVAFGRQHQTEEDFLASAAETMPTFEQEFARLSTRERALEIGCGPGRLMLPMSRHFSGIHGVDVSDEMLEKARHHLRGVSSAHVHRTGGAGLEMLETGWFDFVYSYTVFQHIPDREIVLNYLREAQRVLKPGGVLCCQIRGTAPLASEMERESDTWIGCWFTAGDIVAFSREQKFPLVSLSGLDTQYMWTTFRKPLNPTAAYRPERIDLQSVTATTGPDAVVPARGRAAALSLWITGMPDDASLAECPVLIDGSEQIGCYLSPVSAHENSGGCQIDTRLPATVAPGVHTVQLSVGGKPVSKAHTFTVEPARDRDPKVLDVTDGINLRSHYRFETGGAKVILQDVADPRAVSFTVAGHPAEYLQHECKDPITDTWEFAFHLAGRTPNGSHELSVLMDRRRIASVKVDVAVSRPGLLRRILARS